MFHFATHAVFKALLFMAAGNVIHALRDEQDIRLMGGLRSRMRTTAWTFLFGSLALAGFPLFAGWFSKENLLGFGTVLGPGPAPWLLWLVGVGLNVLTGVYAFRLYFTVFQGEPQSARDWAAKEAPRVMLIPVAILGALCFAVPWLVLQFPLPGTLHFFSDFLAPVFAGAPPNLTNEPSFGLAFVALAVGTIASLFGIGLAIRLWLERRPDPSEVVARLPRLLPQLSYNKFYFDELYDETLVKPIKATARTLRRVVEPRYMDGWISGLVNVMRGFSVDIRSYQTGFIRDYAALFTIFAVIFVVAVVLIAK
jgi:NADH-quinone oxidoreductase subunit L